MGRLFSPYRMQKLQKALKIFVTYISIPSILGILLWYFLIPTNDHLIYHYDYVNGGNLAYRRLCEKGKFSLPYTDECVPWLTCRDIESNDFKIGKVIGSGAVKVVRKAKWNGYDVVLSNLINPAYKEDFRHGLEMLIKLQPSQHLTQLLGYCKNKFVTQYFPLGSAVNMDHVLNLGEYQGLNTLQTRFRFCMNYVDIIKFLHSSPIGTRVMCDSSDLPKTLSQFLITNDFKLVLNDVDALPEVDHSSGGKVKCGSRRLYGDFIAPEQRWNHPDLEFDDSILPPYDEKTDIYKIPDVCEHFLGDSQASEMLKFHLFKLHSQCRSDSPIDRPTAAQIAVKYEEIWESFN